MKVDLILRIAALIICVVIVVKVDSRPRYVECTDNMECGLDSCCVLGGGRFSIPRCAALREVHSICRPTGHMPINATVSYPDGESVKLTNIFSIMCPCQPGLFCSERTGTCLNLSDTLTLNSIN
ncbi:UNVERIFIED_CONTAM: hypothetical protein PYX00_007342 [Menopon gallinae]|uniref:Astakine n=1 Tax=Menopon gallinae TaxID=328185 RepID=A0AAW2HJM1_9NEOP